MNLYADKSYRFINLCFYPSAAWKEHALFLIASRSAILVFHLGCLRGYYKEGVRCLVTEYILTPSSLEKGFGIFHRSESYLL